MSKVLVDRELLCQALGFGMKGEHARSELRGMLSRAQPAEAEGSVEMGSDAWMALHLLDRLDVSADEDPRVQQVEEIVRRMGAALSAVTAERDRLESMLIRTATRHFALQIKDRADDKKLDECLSEGIAMLEAERDQYRAEVEALRKDALIGTDAYRATVYVLRRAACDEVFGVAKLQRVFLLDWQSAERLLKEMVRRGDVEQCAGHGWKFPGAAMAAKEA